MDPTLRQLKTFLTIAQARHVTRAARQLNLTQPAVTHQIRQLEQALGAALVRRDGRQIALTPDGELLVRNMGPLVDRLDVAMRRLRRREPEEISGIVRIATLQSYNASLVVAAALALARQYPGIRIVSREMSADAIEAAVINGQADIGLTFQVRRSAALRTQVLAEEYLLAVCSHALALPPGDGIALADLQLFPLALMPREFALRALIDDLAASSGVALDVAFESSNLSALLGFASQTNAIAIIPQFAAALGQSMRIVRLRDQATRHLAMITPQGQRPDSVEAVMAAIADCVTDAASAREPPPHRDDGSWLP